ncbi:nitrous oxide reductase accessory protein NosL [Malonomonas rubra]|uniref:nitrous oxide reductase accessory protein NosL n=1 Tax=Malonomonas rubra TaxID=57040 RepID=UPI0026E94B9B|nr:nitrous oxide reductase accessory protein NosL [Malonomonas rubra]
MKKITVLVISALLLSAGLLVAMGYEDQQLHASCNYCGMNRVKFGHSRMLIEYVDQSSVGTCSLHCAAVEFAVTIDKDLQTIKVADFNSKELIDAETASWVIGGDKPGVMTSRAKWAFSDQAAAEKFVNSHGGNLADFDQVMKATYEDMYMDTKKIRNKRKMKKMNMSHMEHK